MWRNWEIAKKVALRIILIYIFCGITWVIFSNYLISDYLFIKSDWVEISKGIMFILITGLIFYKLIKKGIIVTIESESKYRTIVENVSDLIAIIDLNGNFEYLSPSHQKIFGYSEEELVGKSVFDFLKVEETSKIRSRLQNIKNQKNRNSVEYNIKHKDGYFVLVEGKGVPIFEENGKTKKIILFSRDITEKKKAEIQLMESEERYRKLVEYSPEVILIHIDGKIVYVNKAGLLLVCANDENQIIGRNVFDFISPEYHDHTRKQLKKVKEFGKSEISEYQIIRLDGALVSVELLTFQTTYKDRSAMQVVIRDITERKKAQEQVQYLAYYDSLTGTPNRNHLYRYLGDVLERNKVNKEIVAVLFLDLDRFKMINDTFGHSFGDHLLQEVSKRLRIFLGKGGILFRYGGDEYVIVVEEAEPSEISQLAEKLIDTFSSPFSIQERQMFISTSIGISLFPKDGETVEALIQKSDVAMYSAKENGKNNFRFYSSYLNINNKRKMEIVLGIRKALEHNEFTLYYQPLVDLDTKKIIGLEALIRWNHPKYGFISPAEFIPVAEESGLIELIGNWVLKTACEQFKRWLDSGFALKRIAVNVSAIQFRDKNFVNTVNQVLHDTKLEACYLELEITESATQQVEEATNLMKVLKESGVQLSIDDFGTGYSSLNYLRQFPIDTLKIDKSFVDEINNNLNGEVIVKTIIELGNSLGFKVVAEGVENEQQLSFLKENNCQIGQGYYFSKPLPTQELENLLKK
ncbi:EAL domain-containing protein [Bacillus sp. BRMEA1]|uniref:sensor domain-containing protein n=1 Tax=Neobacillus endophyticus TaxID=2738405 RepID=UPI001564D29A|nr:EAL domain-containing protein [Neobacillus endophyticus]NRD80156.1 EAL domain-containing protein [Neobacillus endophyticus]